VVGVALAVAKPKPAEADDDLSDIDDPQKPWTPERAAEIKQRLVTAKARANEARRAADSAWSRARAQEERFGRTKSKVLETKQSVEAERVLLDATKRALTSGDKAATLQAIGHLMG